ARTRATPRRATPTWPWRRGAWRTSGSRPTAATNGRSGGRASTIWPRGSSGKSNAAPEPGIIRLYGSSTKWHQVPPGAVRSGAPADFGGPGGPREGARRPGRLLFFADAPASFGQEGRPDPAPEPSGPG